MRAAAPGALLVLIMAQPNLATGMMPYYRHAWGLAPLLITVIFAAYLFALTPTLSLLGTPRARQGWWWRIGVGSAFGIAADAGMAAAHSAWPVTIARVCAGLSVGLVTGSLAGLILERRGESGRTALAAATVLGSALGTVAAAAVAQYLPAPGVTVYLAHAVLLGLVALAVLADRTVRPGTAGHKASARQPAEEPRIAGYLSGIAAWVSAGLVVALLPSYGAELLKTTNLTLLALPVTLYLVCAWLAQQLLPPNSLPAEPVTTQAIIIAGVLIAAAVSWLPSLPLLLAGGVVAGVGQGIAYRSGLRIVSAATPPDQHARASSRFATVAYLCAAVTTVGLGVIANLGSMRDAVLAAAVVLLAVAAATTLVRRRAMTRAADIDPDRISTIA
ncbi:MFS transporter [Nocardia sp. NPDC020380]|uniref:MFS transporter n=1 Tax=Nocardia sp. NPDC020380 TaxID=3364309 RepID=UPI0037B30707